MKTTTTTKTLTLTLCALLMGFAIQAQPQLQPPSFHPPRPIPHGERLGAHNAVAKNPVNYRIHVEWTEPKGDPKSLEVLTTEGNFEYDGIQSFKKINNNDVPVTLKLNGSITALNDDRGRLQLFLGRTVPYVTGSYGSGPHASSSYSQMSVGLQSTIIVTFGKPVVIKSDENGKITVLVKRMKD